LLVLSGQAIQCQLALMGALQEGQLEADWEDLVDAFCLRMK
jgi:hypothetical protein